MESIECVRFATSQKFKIDSFTCLGLQFSGISEAVIKEKIASKDAGFFSEEYLQFLTSPEEAGTSFIGQDLACCGDVNIDLLNQLNTIMSELESSVKMIMISKLDSYMVFLHLLSDTLFKIWRTL